MAAPVPLHHPGAPARPLGVRRGVIGFGGTLGFLSDDEYEFVFCPAQNPASSGAYLDLQGDVNSRFSPDEVVLFSGGLDSFAGIVETLRSSGSRVALISHKSANKLVPVREHLVHHLSRRHSPGRVMHVSVLANLARHIGPERTHRTRSFLFAAIAATVARACGVDGFRFFENGVLSMNLPLLAQVVGSRASRTTHPQVLHGFRRILGALLGSQFEVANPYAWMTKTQVVERIAQHGFADLIRDTRSCSHVHPMTTLHTHCGRCSQCLDRRFAVIAAGMADEDPAEAYGVDLFTGERPTGPDREMALAYVRMAERIKHMSEEAFRSSFGEISRIVPFIPEQADVAAGRIFDLHQRHAAAVCRGV